MMAEKTLFIPLKREHFEAFKNGTKPGMEEFRPYGPRWNEATCRVGRHVTLSMGYGRKHRLTGVVAGFRVSSEPTKSKAWKECYPDKICDAACIKIDVASQRTEPPQ